MGLSHPAHKLLLPGETPQGVSPLAEAVESPFRHSHSLRHSPCPLYPCGEKKGDKPIRGLILSIQFLLHKNILDSGCLSRLLLEN